MKIVKYPRLYREGHSYKLTNKEIKDIKELYRCGKTIKELSKMFNISYVGIRYWVDKKCHNRVLKYANIKRKNENKFVRRLQQKIWVKGKRIKRLEEMRNYVQISSIVDRMLLRYFKKNYKDDYINLRIKYRKELNNDI